MLMAAFALGAAGCGGSAPRQDEDEPAGSYMLEVTRAEFPTEQSLAEKSSFVVEVRNADTKTVPNVAVTVKTQPTVEGEAPTAFGERQARIDLADPARPIWIVDRSPEGADVANTNTWSLGAMKPGETRTFEWRVTAIKAGEYTIAYEVAPGLDGKAKLAAGSPKGTGSFSVTIDGEPAQTRVDADGDVVRLEE